MGHDMNIYSFQRFRLGVTDKRNKSGVIKAARHTVWSAHSRIRDLNNPSRNALIPRTYNIGLQKPAGDRSPQNFRQQNLNRIQIYFIYK